MSFDGLDYFGCDEVVGFDYGTLFQAAGGLATSIADQTTSAEAKNQADVDENKKLYIAMQADIVASNSLAQAAVSAQLKSPAAKKDAIAAAAAANVQEQAGAGLSDASVKARLDAANALLATAQKNAKAKPKDGYLVAVAKAWTVTVQKLHDTVGGGDKGKKDKSDASGESWFTKRVVGPIPGYGVLVVGVGLLGGLGIVVKKIFFK